MPVHLTGRVAEMFSINKIAKKYNLKVLEDSAQAAGSKIKVDWLEHCLILVVFQLIH